MFLICEQCHHVHEFDPRDPYLKECHNCGREILIEEEDVKMEAEYYKLLIDKIEKFKKEKNG